MADAMGWHEIVVGKPQTAANFKATRFLGSNCSFLDGSLSNIFSEFRLAWWHGVGMVAYDMMPRTMIDDSWYTMWDAQCHEPFPCMRVASDHPEKPVIYS